jgi:hypothetical protein
VNETVLVPGGRDVRGTLDPTATDTTRVVVACPPHPQHRGHRGDERLVAVSDALTDAGVNCLRFDYGPWDEGRGEVTDVQNALAWAAERYERVGLFGFSFGAACALAAADPGSPPLAALSVLAPPAGLSADLDAVGALDRLDCPVQVVAGSRDTTVEWEPVVERARERGLSVTELSADHFFVGQSGTVAEVVSAFLLDHV